MELWIALILILLILSAFIPTSTSFDDYDSSVQKDFDDQFSKEWIEYLTGKHANKHTKPQFTKSKPFRRASFFSSSPQYMFISAEAKAEYLQTTTWTNLRNQALIIANHKCQACGSTHSLHCHHTSYEWLSEGGEKELSTLVILCATCHQKVHDLAGYDRTTKYPITLLKDN